MRIVISFTFLMLMTACLFMAVHADTEGPVGLAAYTLNMQGLDWITRTSPHYRIHFLPGSAAERRIDTLIERNETFLKSHLAILEIEKYNKVIDLFYFDSREQIKDVVSKPFRALADADSYTVLAVRNDEETARDAHEIMHVVSFDLWGGWERRDELAWLGEGLATYADEPCNGYDMSVLATHILKNTQDSVPLDSLATSFRQYPEMIGYILMAGFVEFVVEIYGTGHLRNLWNEGFMGFEKVFGKKVTDIEREWHKYMEQTYPKPDIPDWTELKKEGCK